MARIRASDLAALAGVGLAGYMAAQEGRKDKAPVEDRRPPAKEDIELALRPTMDATASVDTPVDTYENSFDTGKMQELMSKAPPRVRAGARDRADVPVQTAPTRSRAPQLNPSVSPTAVNLRAMETRMAPASDAITRAVNARTQGDIRAYDNAQSAYDNAQSAKRSADAAQLYRESNRAGARSNMKRGGAVKRMASGGSVKATVSARGDGIAQRGKTKGRFV